MNLSKIELSTLAYNLIRDSMTNAVYMNDNCRTTGDESVMFSFLRTLVLLGLFKRTEFAARVNFIYELERAARKLKGGATQFRKPW